MFSGVSRHSGTRVTGADSTASIASLGGWPASTMITSVRWIITSATVRSGRSSRPPSGWLAVLLGDAALAMQQVDGAAQFLVRGQHRLVLAELEAGERQHAARPAIAPR